MTQTGFFVTDDFSDDFGGLRLLALMYWPNDEKTRTSFLAWEAAKILEALKRESSSQDKEQFQRMAVACLSEGEGDVEAIQKYADIVAEHGDVLLKHSIIRFSNKVQTDVFDMLGGLGALTQSKSFDAVQQSANISDGFYGQACGEIIFYMMKMHFHHREINSSFNRACSLLVQQAKASRRQIPPVRWHSRMMVRWGGIAPTWAACFFLQAKMNTPLDIHDQSTRFKILFWSEVITEWCLKFKSTGSKTTTLSNDRAIRFLNAPRGENLPVRRLSAQQLTWAMAYKVRS